MKQFTQLFTRSNIQSDIDPCGNSPFTLKATHSLKLGLCGNSINFLAITATHLSLKSKTFNQNCLCGNSIKMLGPLWQLTFHLRARLSPKLGLCGKSINLHLLAIAAFHMGHCGNFTIPLEINPGLCGTSVHHTPPGHCGS